MNLAIAHSLIHPILLEKPLLIHFPLDPSSAQNFNPDQANVRSYNKNRRISINNQLISQQMYN